MNRGDYMYNRYVPNAQGGFDRVRVDLPQDTVLPEALPVESAKTEQFLRPLQNLLPKQMDAGDLLLTLVFLLVLLDADKEDIPTALIMLAAFIFG